MRRVPLCLLLAVCLTLPASSHASSAPHLVGVPSAGLQKVATPDGYRKARPDERSSMKRARRLGLTRTYGWFIGRRDASLAIICGYEGDRRSGTYLKRSGRGWQRYPNQPSGFIQYSYLICTRR